MKTARSIRIVEEKYKESWDAVAGHPLQSWAWGEFRNRMNLEVVRIGLFTENKLTEGWQMTIHPVPHTPFTIGYLPKCPMPGPDLIEALRNTGKDRRTVFFQIEPNVLKNSSPLPTTLVPSHHPLFTKWTFVLDLGKPESELMAAMHSKTRYNIKVAQKHGVTVREDSSEEGFRAYLKLTEETTNRQAFYAHSRRYHEAMWEVLRKAGTARLFTASFQGQILAAWVLFVWKDTLYYPYGASSRTHREVMAPTLLLWETARWGKSQGLKRYDLWGALGPSPAGQPDIHDPWYGFHRFKEGFHPELVEYAGSFDLVVNPLVYHIYGVADALRWKYLKLRKSLF